MKTAAAVEKSELLSLRNIKIFCGLFVIVLYANTLRNGYNFDDSMVVQKHRLTSKGISAIPEIFRSPYYQDEMGYYYEYRPVTLATFAIEHQFFGDNPTVSHLVNLLLYVLCVIIFISSVALMLPENSLVLLLVSSVLFLVHPLHTEVVASIKNRDELLSLMFALFALYHALMLVVKSSLWRVIPVVIFLIGGLLSKSSCASFLFIIPFAVSINPVINIKKTVWLLAAVIMAAFSFIVIRGYPLEWFIFIAPAIISVSVIVYAVKSGKLKHWVLVPIECLGLDKINAKEWIAYFVTLILCAGAFFINEYFSIAALVLFFAFNIYLSRKYDAGHLLLTLFFAPVVFLYENTTYSLMFFSIYVLHKQDRTSENKYLRLLIHSIVFILFSIKITLLGTVDYILALFILHSFEFSRKFKKWSLIAAVIWLIGFTVQLFGVIAEINSVAFDNLCFLAFFVLAFFYSVAGSSKSKIITISALMLMLASFVTGVCIHSFSTKEEARITALQQSEMEIQTQPEITNVAKDEKPRYRFQSEDRPIDFVEFPLGFNTTFSEKVATVSFVLGYYLKMMFVPYPMSFYYGYSKINVKQLIDIWVILSIMVHLLLVLSMIYFMKRHPLYSFGVLAYLSSIFLFSNLVTPVAGMIGDRLTFVASFGFSIATGYIAVKFYEKINVSKKKLVFYGAIAVLLLFSGMTIARNAQWKDYLTLYRHDIQHLDNSANAHNVLANRLVNESNKTRNPVDREKFLREAVVHYKRALEIYPPFFNAQYDLARTYGLLSDAENAIHEYKKTIALDSLYPYPYVQIGLIYESQNQPAQAIPYFQKFLELNPTDLQMYNTLSSLYFRIGDYENSIKTNLKAMEKLPGTYDPVVNIGKTYFTMGDKKNALIYFEKAYLINPNDINLVTAMANTYKELGNKERADFYFTKLQEFRR